MQIGAEDDQELADTLLAQMQENKVDYTGFFRKLSCAADGDLGPVLSLFPEENGMETWLTRWKQRLGSEAGNGAETKQRMDSVNPVYIPRNHKVEEALRASESGDYDPVEKLLGVLADPYSEREGLDAYAAPAPKELGPYRTFCGT